MKYYLAGPMTGYPQFNFPLFDKVTAELRAAGYDVISPAELDSPAVREEAMASPDGVIHGGKVAGETWGQILARDVRVIAVEVDGGVIVLPGWNKSRGARLETFVALLCRKPVFDYIRDLAELHPAEVLLSIVQGFAVGERKDVDVYAGFKQPPGYTSDI